MSYWSWTHGHNHSPSHPFWTRRCHCSFRFSLFLPGCRESRRNPNSKHENVGIQFLRIINSYGKSFLIIPNPLRFLQSRYKVLLPFLLFLLHFYFFLFPIFFRLFGNLLYWNKQRILVFLNFSYFAIGTRDGFKVFDSETGTLRYERGKFFNTSSYSLFLFVYLIYICFLSFVESNFSVQLVFVNRKRMNFCANLSYVLIEYYFWSSKGVYWRYWNRNFVENCMYMVTASRSRWQNDKCQIYLWFFIKQMEPECIRFIQ